MKITAFNGSPRGEKGNTHIIVREFLNGAAAAGAEVENIFLVEKDIKHCRGCFACWTKTPGKCVIKDDMAELLAKIVSSDVIAYATPLYIDNVSGIMKDFMDRIIPIADPHFYKDEGGESRHLPGAEMKKIGKSRKIVVISNCGFPEQSQFQVLRLLFRRIARNSNAELIGEIYRGAGAVLGISSPILDPIIAKYKSLLRQAGKEVVGDQKISENTMELLEKPIVPDEQYISATNQHWDRELARLQ